MMFKKFKANKRIVVKRQSNIIQSDEMGYPLLLCIMSDGSQQWIDVDLKWAEKDILRREAHDALLCEMCGTDYQSDALCALTRCESKEVEPVKHGYWIEKHGKEYCSNCMKEKFEGLKADIWAYWDIPHCPHCGIKMEREITR